MKTIAIANQKGGAGKSTTAAALAGGLTRRGFKTLAIDLDPQCNLTYISGIDEGGANVYDVLTKTAKAEDAIKVDPRYDVLPAAVALAGADGYITETGKEYRLKEVLEGLAGAYDFIVIDTPPALGILTVNALTAADCVIIPAQADILSLQGIDNISETIKTIQRYTNPGLTVAGILLTRFNGRAVISREIAEAAAEIARPLESKVFDAHIREAVAVKEAQLARRDLYEYAPHSTAAADYEALTDEFLREAGK